MCDGKQSVKGIIEVKDDQVILDRAMFDKNLIDQQVEAVSASADLLAKLKEVGAPPPINPVGECFDSVGVQVMQWLNDAPFKVCHGIGIANFPGQEGSTIKHAWLERGGFAYDTTFGVKCPVDEYRAGLHLTYVVEYEPMIFFRNWIETDFPGPWDEKIKAIKSDKEKRRG